MNGITFTNDPVLASQASTDPGTRVVIVTEHAPAVLLQNPNVVKLPVLLPPFNVVSVYVDYGEDAFKEAYLSYLNQVDIIMNIFLVGAAMHNKNVVVYTTDEEWSKDSIPFMDVLMSVFAASLQLQMTYSGPNMVSFIPSVFSIGYAVTNLFQYGYINEQSYVRYMANTSFDRNTVNSYLLSKNIKLDDEVPVELQDKAFQNIIAVKSEDPDLTPALMGD
jgi:hypothetical protein